MPRTLSSSEAKSKFGAVMESVVRDNDEVIVETHGRPKVAIIPFSKYEQLRELAEQERRREAWRLLEALRERVSARNQDLTDAEADRMAEEITRDAVASLIRKGKFRIASDK